MLLARGLVGAESDVTYDTLRHRIVERHATTIPAVLGLLPERLRASYTLLYASQSLHGASYTHPRVILFSDTATLILAFNGDSSQSSYHRLEVIQFRDASKSFEFRSIDFERGQAEFSPPNPPACLACHGQSPRPIWASYPVWPGAYGSLLDAIRSDLRPEEIDPFREFVHKMPMHDRYRFLVRRPESHLYPYLPDWTRQAKVNPHVYRPNNRFGKLVARLQAQHIAHRLRRGEFYRAYPYTSLYWLIDCAPRPAAFDRRVAELFAHTFPATAYPDLYRDLDTIQRRYATAFMFEKLLTGLDVYTWSLSRTTLPHGRRWESGYLLMDQLVAARVLETMAADQADVRAYYQPLPYATVYDRQNGDGYAEKNLAPGGVGAAYDRLGLHFDEARAQEGCGAFYDKARAELGLPS